MKKELLVITHAVRYLRFAACRRTDKNDSPNQQSCEKELLLKNTNNGANQTEMKKELLVITTTMAQKRHTLEWISEKQ